MLFQRPVDLCAQIFFAAVDIILSATIQALVIFQYPVFVLLKHYHFCYCHC